MSNIPSVKLRTGLEIPALALGTWKIPDGESVVNSIKCGTELGYKSIDTAAVYKNEVGVGEGVRKSGIPREELYVTTKIWNGEQGYEETLAGFGRSLDRLNIGYVDELLIHWPCPDNLKYVDTWRALQTLYNDGKVKTIGVCNFTIRHLENLRANCEMIPLVNQIEMHPYFVDLELLAYCREHGILVEVYSPLMNGGEVLRDPVIAEIGKKYNKTVAQVILRYLLQLGTRVLVKSVHKERLQENMEVFDFNLEEEDMIRMKALNRGMRYNMHPELDNFAVPLDEAPVK